MDDAKFQKMLQLEENRPAPGVKTPHLGAPEGMVKCACDKKVIPLSEVRYYNTGILQASDNVCNECYRSMPKFAMIVCIKCKAVVARVAPEKFANGFAFVADKCYHTEACPNCSPDIERSFVIEKRLYDEKRGPTKIIVNP